MSSPIANQRKNILKKSLITFHKKASHSNRTKILSNYFSEIIIKNYNFYDKKNRILDIGTGDMSIAEQIAKQIPNVEWSCIDIHKKPENLNEDARWDKYTQFNGKDIPYPDENFDFSIFSDVLHHSLKDANDLLSEALRVSKFVLIKDHFEYSIYSRSMLKIMDIVGNWGYGVSIPKKYFSIKQFKNIIQQNKAEIVDLKIGIELYKHLPILNILLSSKWQFIALIKTTN